ncbi:MAG: hypothetical protein ABIH09_04765 [Candidatus Omnitrophota bacterium]
MQVVLIVIKILFIMIKSFLWLTLLALAVGAIRLFFIGIFKQYQNTITDVSMLRKGDIILTGKQSAAYSFPIQLSNVLTRKVKHRFWTHAAIYKGEGMLWEAQPKGIVERRIKDYLDNGYIIKVFRHKYIKDEKILEQAVDYCAKQKGRPYGFGGLGFFILSSFTPISFNWAFANPIVDKICKMDNAYFCSELIVEAFENINYPVSPYDGWRVKPSDFISNPLLEEV